ncbi:MAG TPA: hypothetical protein VGQ42_08415 [Candidatus Dormibacteraeota bacterium]|nr:hypothetical protein [Candidatus Dormibacteraeota bacterium]
MGGDASFVVVAEAEAPRPLPFGPGWPSFIGHDAIANRLMPVVHDLIGDYSMIVMSDDGRVAAGGWGLPLHWDGTVEDLPAGWDGALERAAACLVEGRPANTFCAMATEVVAGFQGRRLSARVLAAIRDNAYTRGLRRMIAPTRPTLKSRYPLTPIARYAWWQREDGTPFDPWVRMHTGVGAHVLAPAPVSMTITGTVADWESWAGMLFPDSGDYVIPDALDVLHVDRAADTATYIEPAIWVRHPDAM